MKLSHIFCWLKNLSRLWRSKFPFNHRGQIICFWNYVTPSVNIQSDFPSDLERNSVRRHISNLNADNSLLHFQLTSIIINCLCTSPLCTETTEFKKHKHPEFRWGDRRTQVRTEDSQERGFPANRKLHLFQNWVSLWIRWNLFFFPVLQSAGSCLDAGTAQLSCLHSNTNSKAIYQCHWRLGLPRLPRQSPRGQLWADICGEGDRVTSGLWTFSKVHWVQEMLVSKMWDLSNNICSVRKLKTYSLQLEGLSKAPVFTTQRRKVVDTGSCVMQLQ